MKIVMKIQYIVQSNESNVSARAISNKALQHLGK